MFAKNIMYVKFLPTFVIFIDLNSFQLLLFDSKREMDNLKLLF